jgi:serpin B
VSTPKTLTPLALILGAMVVPSAQAFDLFGISTATSPSALVAVSQPAAPLAETLETGGRRFARDLLREVAREKGNENLILSPFSVASAFGMTARGAAGETGAEIHRTLGIPAGDSGHEELGSLTRALEASGPGTGEEGDERVVVAVANRLFPSTRTRLAPDYLEGVRSAYGAEPEPLAYGEDLAPEFRTRYASEFPDRLVESWEDYINTWVYKKTRTRIDGLIPPGSLTPSTSLVLTNAVYFRGCFESPFDAKLTRDGDFYVGGSPQARRMMTGTMVVPYSRAAGRGPAGMASGDAFASGPAYDLVELPYKGGEYGLVILAPRTEDGVHELLEKLSPEEVEARLAGARARKVRVTVPAFRIETSHSLKGTMQTLGVKTAWTGQADFSRMTTGSSTYVSDAFHKAFVEVGEECTEAAAATAVVMRTRSISMGPPRFRADRPFLYLIRHRATGTWLFVGRVMDPQG